VSLRRGGDDGIRNRPTAAPKLLERRLGAGRVTGLAGAVTELTGTSTPPRQQRPSRQNSIAYATPTPTFGVPLKLWGLG